ncbi:hypothetical protein BDV96DRAFT_684544 [Lophiotrema nucula]|uniref:Uncharacterized protein n=1 Tax=Lophiotrema nucula TaxID=690887 RepID=A0A6A5ZIP4_9PLEO|nr:hypothetical protein BDV96DRAFT_684544 [Lophiotrema nucula]
MSCPKTLPLTISTCSLSDTLSTTPTAQPIASSIASASANLASSSTIVPAGTIGAGMTSFLALKDRVTALASVVSEANVPTLEVPPGWEQAALPIKVAVAAAAIGGLAWWQYRLRTAGPQAQQARDFVRAQRPKGVDEKEWRKQTDLIALKIDKAAQQVGGLKAQFDAVQEGLMEYKEQLGELRTSSVKKVGGVGASKGQSTEHEERHIPNHSTENEEMTDASDLPPLWRPDEPNTPPLHMSRPQPKTHRPFSDEALVDRLFPATAIDNPPRPATPSTRNDFQQNMEELLKNRMKHNSGKLAACQMTTEELGRDLRRELDLYRYPDTNGLSPFRLREQQERNGLSSSTTTSGGKRKADEAETELEQAIQAPKKQKTDPAAESTARTPGRYQLRPTHARKASIVKLSEKAKGKQKVEVLRAVEPGYTPQPPYTPGEANKTNGIHDSSGVYIRPHSSQIRMSPQIMTPYQAPTPELTTPDAQMMDLNWRYQNGVHTEEVETPLTTMKDLEESVAISKTRDEDLVVQFRRTSKMQRRRASLTERVHELL